MQGPVTFAGALHRSAALTGVLVALTLAAVPSWVLADAHAFKPVGGPDNVVYVESNIGTPNGNSIFAFSRDANGTLTPLPGSPFPTGGTGVFDLSLALGPFDSDQEVISNPEHTLLFAVNSGSNTIAVMHIHPDGTLAPVAGSPFDSGGVNPVSVGLAGDTLVVVNKNQDPNQPVHASLPNYTSFHVRNDGQLDQNPDSTYWLDQGASPTQACVPPHQNLVFGTDFFGEVLQSFRIGEDGVLRQNKPQGPPASEYLGSPTAPRYPIGLATVPGHSVLYAGFVTISRMGVYTYDHRGVLTFQRSVPIGGAAICWIVVNKEGTRAYTGNTGDNSVSVFDLSNPLDPAVIQHVLLQGPGNVLQLSLDSNGTFLYAVSQRTGAATPLGQGNGLHVLKIASDGTLSEAPGSPVTLPVPDGTRSQGVAAL